MSIHIITGAAKVRRLILSCDVQGCPVRVEPPAAERWRSDNDAQASARAWAVERSGWTHDRLHGTDYCPEHAAASTRPIGAVTGARPTATVRNDKSGEALDRDDYAAGLRARLAQEGRDAERLPVLTAVEAEVVVRLLDELAGVYLGEALGALARELSVRLSGRPRRI